MFGRLSIEVFSWSTYYAALTAMFVDSAICGYMARQSLSAGGTNTALDSRTWADAIGLGTCGPQGC